MRELYLGYAVTSGFYFWTLGIQDNKKNYKIVLKYFEMELMSVQWHPTYTNVAVEKHLSRLQQFKRLYLPMLLLLHWSYNNNNNNNNYNNDTKKEYSKICTSIHIMNLFCYTD
jgi:hypothetical protein